MAWKKSTDIAYWTRQRPRPTAEAGLHIKIVNSNNGPFNKHFKAALWSSGNSSNQVCVCVCVRAHVHSRLEEMYTLVGYLQAV